MDKNGISTLYTIISFFLALVSFGGVIYSSLIVNGDFNYDILKDLFKPNLTIEYLSKVSLLLSILCIVPVVVMRFIFRNEPLTILAQTVKMEIISLDYSKALFKRSQLLRPNRKGIGAYTACLSPNAPEASIDIDSIECTSYTPGILYEDCIQTTGTGTTKIDFVHEFGHDLPFSYIMLLLPRIFINIDHDRNPDFISRNLVTRKFKSEHYGEHNVRRPLISFDANQYPQYNFTFLISFPDKIPPSLKMSRLKNGSLIKLSFEDVDGKTARVFIRYRFNESLRITWENDQYINQKIDQERL